MTRINQATKLLIAVPAALAIASCSAAEDTTADTAAETGGEAPTVTASIGGAGAETEKTVTEAAAQQPASEAAPPPAVAPEGGNCASLPTDPRQRYATGTAPGRMPANNGSDNNYWIEDIDNQYDPCAELSWITFKGSLGNADRPQGTAASIADGLALYLNGEPASEVKLFGRIDQVTPLDNGGATIEWSERGQYTADGFTNHYSADIRATQGGVEAFAGDTEKFNDSWNYPVGYLLN
ncbi:hypothetical protein HMPREF3151_11225 [Corynebacterium sp. HMSC05H05]|uniref:hypothetical protein n=1 Tax=Corynebacterium sp. HMSC05H05 TaxID=1581119 RepID=UPI0008A1CA47|nr:hypothetical protein [Corynebacterium sp. HMSC05H05]OFT55609.1 hypothetical protein HMPREF3151_11225 [Corynebacterium sp. HMSC05H05]